MKKLMFKNLDEVRKFYGQTKCKFVNFDGPEAHVQFNGVNSDKTEINIVVGGCAAYLAKLVFGPEDMSVYTLLGEHVSSIELVDEDGNILFKGSSGF